VDDLKYSIEKPLILFVCTGNICRSPLAEFYTRSLIELEDLPFRISSTGFFNAGVPISGNSRILLKEAGIDADRHVSSHINNKLIDNSWLILTMENDHKMKLIEINSDAEKKIFTLSEYCGEEFRRNSLDIEDPYGSDLSRYRITFDLIKERVDRLINIIKEEVE